MDETADQAVLREGYAPVTNGELYYRVVGRGRPIIVIHGGPDFDHSYLLPDMDRLADSYRLIYYDQMGRGKSVGRIGPDGISIKTEVEDLEDLRKYFQLDKVAILGHSWGGHLAMEYALRYEGNVSHMILMNSSVASHEDYLLLQEESRRRKAPYEEALRSLVSSVEFREGDPDAVAAYYRIHFSTTIDKQEQLERLVERLRLSFTRENVLRGRAIEERLFEETWSLEEFDLFPGLGRLNVPTLVIHGDYDFIPVVCAEHIAEAIPGARFVVLKNCGHFSYIECPEAVSKEIAGFIDA
jgi:proline iminopeptidase